RCSPFGGGRSRWATPRARASHGAMDTGAPGRSELLVGLDADDTLWHSEVHFELTQRLVCELLAPHVPPADFEARLLATERRNLGVFGYGVKGYALSLIET